MSGDVERRSPSMTSGGQTVPENFAKSIKFSVHSGDTVSVLIFGQKTAKINTRSRSMPLGSTEHELARLRRVNRGIGWRGEHNRRPRFANREFPHDFLQAGMQKVVGIDRRLK